MIQMPGPGVNRIMHNAIALDVRRPVSDEWERTRIARSAPRQQSSIGKRMNDNDLPTPAQVQAGLIQDIADRKDRNAFARLFDLYAPRLKAQLMRTGATADAAEDFAQEALFSVWRKASYFDPARASASTWIFTIARNLRIDAARRSKRASVYAILEEMEPESPEQPDEVLGAAERQERVRAAMSVLPPEQLEVIRLSFVDGLTHSEIAQALNLPLGTVKSRTRLAMTRMRQQLEDLK